MRGGGHGRHRGHGEGPFRRGGFRRTAPRQAVLEIMSEADDYLGADEVYRRVFDRLEGIGIATVYRTLQLLTELGVLGRVVGDDGKARYRLADERAAPHRVVLVCRRCGRRIAVPARGGDDGGDSRVGQAIDALTRAIESEHDFGVEQSAHQLVGLCADCSNEHDSGRGRGKDAD